MLASTRSSGGGTSSIPAAPDETIAAMRPTHPSLGEVLVGPGRPIETIEAAVTECLARQAAARTLYGISSNSAPPWLGVNVIIDPGDYWPTSNLGFPHWCAIYAADTTKHSTIIHTGLETITGYWEGVDVINEPPPYDEKYPMHLANGGTTIIVRCTLNNNYPASGGGDTWLGMDGGRAGCTTVFYDVDGTPGGSNLHGWGEGQTGPSTVCYVNSRSAGGPFNAANFAGGPTGFDNPGDMWVVGGSAKGLTMDGINLHLDPAFTLVGGGTVQRSHSGVTDSRTDWPIPVGGLSARDRALWGM
ncbi:hypothetical protein ACSDQ9_05710 [Aestuariimicrobium soli]|uniref:hypothetical protein n=1 Tax=Aestuariimicrobium soli TaxID=2035834 RepID=UPI003EC0CB95